MVDTGCLWKPPLGFKLVESRAAVCPRARTRELNWERADKGASCLFPQSELASPLSLSLHVTTCNSTGRLFFLALFSYSFSSSAVSFAWRVCLCKSCLGALGPLVSPVVPSTVNTEVLLLCLWRTRVYRLQSEFMLLIGWSRRNWETYVTDQTHHLRDGCWNIELFLHLFYQINIP